MDALEDLGCSRIFSPSAPILQPAFNAPSTHCKLCIACQALCCGGDTFIVPKTRLTIPPRSFVCECNGMGGSGCLFAARFSESMSQDARRAAVGKFAAHMRDVVVVWTDKAQPVLRALLSAVEPLVAAFVAPLTLEAARDLAVALLGSQSKTIGDPATAQAMISLVKDSVARGGDRGRWLLPFADPILSGTSAGATVTCRYCRRALPPRSASLCKLDHGPAAYVVSEAFECTSCGSQSTRLTNANLPTLLRRSHQSLLPSSANGAVGSTTHAGDVKNEVIGTMSYALALAAVLDAVEVDVKLVFLIRIALQNPFAFVMVEFFDPIASQWLCCDPTTGALATPPTIAATPTASTAFATADAVWTMTLDGEVADVSSTYLPRGKTEIDADAVKRAFIDPAAANAAKRIRDESTMWPSRRVEAAQRRERQRRASVISAEVQGIRAWYADIPLCPHDAAEFAAAVDLTSRGPWTALNLLDRFAMANQALLDTTADNDSDVPLRPYRGELSCFDRLIGRHRSAQQQEHTTLVIAFTGDDATEIANDVRLCSSLLNQCLLRWPERHWPALSGVLRIFVKHADDVAAFLDHVRVAEWAGILRDRIFAADMMADQEVISAAAAPPRWSPDNVAAVVSVAQVAIDVWHAAGASGLTGDDAWANKVVAVSQIAFECASAIAQPLHRGGGGLVEIRAPPPPVVSHAFCGIVEASVEGLVACAATGDVNLAVYSAVIDFIATAAVVLRGSWHVALDDALSAAFLFVSEFEQFSAAVAPKLRQLAENLRFAPAQQLRAAIQQRCM